MTYTNRTKLLTIEEARNCLDYWQRRLRLTEWTITIEIVSALKLARNGTDLLLGECEVLRKKQIAVIRLLRPDDFTADIGFIPYQDMELTLIHELLHVRLDGLRDRACDTSELLEERAIHALSQTLCELNERKP